MIARPDPAPHARQCNHGGRFLLQNALAMNECATDRSRSSARRFPLRLAALAFLAVAAPIACVPRDPPPVDPQALQRIEREGSAGTRYERLAPLASPDYYLNPRDRNDPRNYDPSPNVRAEVARGGDARMGQIGLQIPTTRPSATQAATQPSNVVYLPLQECIQRATV